MRERAAPSRPTAIPMPIDANTQEPTVTTSTTDEPPHEPRHQRDTEHSHEARSDPPGQLDEHVLHAHERTPPSMRTLNARQSGQ
jgi:hypothetical protein